MHTAIKLPLSSANPAVISDLQRLYPDAEVHIVTKVAAKDTSLVNEERFWEIITLLDWDKAGNDDAVIEPAIRKLVEMGEPAILSFYDLLAEKLYLLDGRNFAEHSVNEGEHFSADLFLYARCAVIANGREFYEEVLGNPAAFPKDLYFEAIMDIPDHAWLRKTGGELQRLPKYNYETGFNPNGWGADTITI